VIYDIYAMPGKSIDTSNHHCNKREY